MIKLKTYTITKTSIESSLEFILKELNTLIYNNKNSTYSFLFDGLNKKEYSITIIYQKEDVIKKTSYGYYVVLGVNGQIVSKSEYLKNKYLLETEIKKNLINLGFKSGAEEDNLVYMTDEYSVQGNTRDVDFENIEFLMDDKFNEYQTKLKEFNLDRKYMNSVIKSISNKLINFLTVMKHLEVFIGKYEEEKSLVFQDDTLDYSKVPEVKREILREQRRKIKLTNQKKFSEEQKQKLEHILVNLDIRDRKELNKEEVLAYIDDFDSKYRFADRVIGFTKTKVGEKLTSHWYVNFSDNNSKFFRPFFFKFKDLIEEGYVELIP